MNVEVSGEKIISGIQKEFHEAFPFLKIEFYQPGNANLKNPVQVNKKFGAFGSNSHSEPIIITPSSTVAELEHKFLAKYRLSSKIFRQSGKAWLEISLTYSWTLEQQNEQGRALSSQIA